MGQMDAEGKNRTDRGRGEGWDRWGEREEVVKRTDRKRG